MQNPPRVLAIHDLSGFGRCSLTVVIPVLSALGAQCCPLPTAIFSTHTAFEGFVMHDTTKDLAAMFRHLKALGVRFDAIYSGFLGSAEQIDLVIEAIELFRDEGTLVLVDPVMGDNGKPYKTYTPEMCANMGRLAERADILTPNVTEAAILLGEPYITEEPGRDRLVEWLWRLSQDGRRAVVMTGIPEGASVGSGYFDCGERAAGFAFQRSFDAHFPGTGDLFASVLLGKLLDGRPLAASVEAASAFVLKAIERTLANATPPREGVAFEPLLPLLWAER